MKNRKGSDGMAEVYLDNLSRTDNLRIEHERIREVVAPIAKKHSVKKMYLFGSRARGDYSSNSDYDFVIERGEISSVIEHMGFVYDLEEKLSAHVDVVSEDCDDPDFLAYIESEEVLLYEQI